MPAGLPVSVAKSTAYEASHVVKDARGALLALYGYNSKGSAQWIQVHDAAAAPSDTAIPLFTATVPASSNFAFTFPEPGLPCSSGIVVVNSSTGPTKTAGSADAFFTALYR